MKKEKPPKKKLKECVRKIKALLVDVDGVLTDGRIIYSSDDGETKSFNAKDGYGITRAIEEGIVIGIITGRSSDIVTRRADELGIAEIFQGVSDKLACLEEFRDRYGFTHEEVAYIGDDEPDIPLLETVGFSCAPRDAHETVLSVVDYTSSKRGGRGAVREVIDVILENRKGEE